MAIKHVIIDGFNVLGAMGYPPHQVLGTGEHIREEFIVRVGAYGQRLHCPMTVVFDAWQQTGQVRQIAHRAGVTVIYTAHGERADQVLQQVIRDQGKTIAVVSSDHEVLQVAGTFGAVVIRSQEFISRMQAKNGRQSTGSRSRGTVEDEDGGPTPARSKEKKGNPRKLPKKLRQRNRIMKRF